jgi:three-Cys-motif partner protein
VHVETFSARQTRFVPGDSNENVDEILSYIPQYSKTFRVLTFCFVDPFNVDNLKFETIRRLAGGDRRIDFLVLVPSGMDAQRNWQHDNNLYTEFLGNRDWRTEWQHQQQTHRSFANFFVDEFGKSMDRIGFRWGGTPSTRVIKNEKQSAMYHLAFFSRASIASTFWDDCKELTSQQQKLRFT